jgi:flavin-dependent dehydrogenase
LETHMSVPTGEAFPCRSIPSSEDWDVVVIGAGIAGAICAKLLAERGWRVLLVDRQRFPRAKVCGGCWNQRGIAALEQAGLGAVLDECSATDTQELRIYGDGLSIQRRMPQGRAVSRIALDRAIVSRAVARGVEFCAPLTASLGPIVDRWRSVQVRSNREVRDLRARVVVVAAGLGAVGVLRNDRWKIYHEPDARIGVGTVLPERGWQTDIRCEPPQVAMSVGTAGYVGMVRVEQQQLEIAAALRPAEVRRCGAVWQAVEQLLREAGGPLPVGLTEATWRATPPLTRSVVPVADQRVFLVGDAAGYVEPFTGEGMTWAATGAVALAELADKAIIHWDDRYASQWIAHWSSLVRGRQWICRSVRWGLGQPVVRRSSLRAIRWIPCLLDPFINHINRAATGPRHISKRMPG